MIIDTHVHFWNYDPVRDSWIDEQMQRIRRDFNPQDVLNTTEWLPVEGFVAVQASQAQEETDFLLRLADEYPQIKGVIGWLDLRSPKVSDTLLSYTQHAKFKGLRHVVQAEAPGFLLDLDFQRGIEQMAPYNLVYEILIYHYQLTEAVTFTELFPQQRFVLDHIAKPDIKGGGWQVWAEPFKALSQHPDCYCKLSGMVTEADWDNWTKADFEAYLDTALQAFGPSRLLFGSDWPVCLVAAEYDEVLAIVTDFLSQLSIEEQEQIRYRNAINCYQLSM